MVSTDEQRVPTWLATISALVVVSAFVAGKAARDAILLSRFSIQSLPLFVGLSAALSLPVIIVAGKWMTRFGPARLVPALNAASGVFAVLEFLLIGNYPRPIAVLAFFHLNTASAVLVSGFWSIVNERFDIHTAKRHIGRIGMGATLGGILGGVLAERTAVYLPHDSILIVIAGLQLVCAAMLYLFGRGAPIHAAQPAEHEGTWSALGAVARSTLLRKVGLIVVLTAVGAGALDYVFKADIVAGAPREQLLRQLALFYTATNVITAVFQVALCGPLITRLGVPRSVATLPYAITGFSILALAVPVPLSATIARSAELVTRNSIYRAGYELLYAPMPADQKRPTKVVLDVGADKIGDILAAQMVGAIVYLATDVRTGLLVAAFATGVVGVMIAMRLPRSYTAALEDSLLEAAAEMPPSSNDPEPWITLTGIPKLGHPADVVPLRLRNRRPPAAVPKPPPEPPSETERLVRLTRALRSGDSRQIQRALAAPLPVELVPIAIELVAADEEIARAAVAALRTAAPRCTGLLVDVLLDSSRELALRRRLPAIVGRGEPYLAAWGLWRTIADPSFELRYQASAVLAPLAARGHLPYVTEEEVYDCVRRELIVDRSVWSARRYVRDTLSDDEEDELRADISLEHVFRVLGLVLPAEPLRIALHAVQTDDASFRGMALEYLESILPPDVHAQLWPLLDLEVPERPVDALHPRNSEALVAQLNLSYQSILEKLKQRRHHG